jgi:hypothetical protein
MKSPRFVQHLGSLSTHECFQRIRAEISASSHRHDAFGRRIVLWSTHSVRMNICTPSTAATHRAAAPSIAGRTLGSNETTPSPTHLLGLLLLSISMITCNALGSIDNMVVLDVLTPFKPFHSGRQS